MARALVFAAAVALGLAVQPGGPAAAGPRTSKVTIETDPPGAKVYFNLKEDGEICTTPCTVDAPIGETPIIVEAENRRAIIENLVVPKKTARPIKVSYKLEPAVGALIVEGGAGATIKIDDEDHGKAPRRLDDVIAGAHHVVLERDGKKIYDDFVEIETGREVTVTAATADVAPAASIEAVAVTAPAPGPRDRSAPSLAVTLAVDAGFRQFTYEGNASEDKQRDDREVGQVMIGPIVELWPTRLLGLGVLRGLALYARLELGVNKQDVTIRGDATMAGLRLQTSWRSLEVSAHHRWTIRERATLEVGGGYTDDGYQFTGEAEDRAIVPDAAYKTVRIGGRASLLLGSLEPYLAFENRIVLSGGVMEQRYKLGTSTNGVRGSLGAIQRFGHFHLRLEATITRYGWDFRPDNADMTAPKATGGRDLIENVMVALGYAYY